MSNPRLTRLRRLGWLGGALLTVVTGLFCFGVPGLGLADRSFDFSFHRRPLVELNDIVVIMLDESSRRDLNQRASEPWDRQLHTDLLGRLTRDGARLIFFDILFQGETDADANFAKAIREQGNVILASILERREHETSTSASGYQQSILQPVPVLAQAARGVGLVEVFPSRARLGGWQMYTGGDAPAAVWLAAEAVDAPVTRDPSRRGVERWLNFYGETPAFNTVSFSQALASNGVPANFFAGKYVFIGGDPLVFGAREKFGTPFGDAPGVEILTTAFANLVRGEWLERTPDWPQALAILGWGVLLGGLVMLRPWHAGWVAVVTGLAVAAGSTYAQFHYFRWWTWLVSALVQPSVALLWSVGYQYVTEGRRRRQLVKAFGGYLSPHLAGRIAESEFDLALGGEEVEATVLFTDLEGFTAMSEKLPPQDVSRILTAYFSQTTRHILERDGTIIKYIGDAVMAVWGAPLPDADQCERAVLAACGIIQAGQQEILGRRLRTRIGIHTGLAVAGNLGSDFRFDYTVVGATTNLASRLEHLNQPLGTEILVSDATRHRLSGRIRLRCLGRFLAKGITEPFTVHEVLGTSEQLAPLPPWVGVFDHALTTLTKGEWDEAERGFLEVIQARGGKDGPSEFFMQRLSTLRTAGPPWDGVVRLM